MGHPSQAPITERSWRSCPQVLGNVRNDVPVVGAAGEHFVRYPRTVLSPFVSSPGLWPCISLHERQPHLRHGPGLAQQSIASAKCAPQYPVSPGPGGLGGGLAKRLRPPAKLTALPEERQLSTSHDLPEMVV